MQGRRKERIRRGETEPNECWNKKAKKKIILFNYHSRYKMAAELAHSCHSD